MKNTQRQPSDETINAISGGAITAPTLEPVLKIPNAIARSRGGNHSATTLPDPGNPPPSPIPSRKRYTPSPRTDVAVPVKKLAADHQMIITAYPARAPSQSMMRPPPAYMIAYA